jgi:hypothetical protein
MGRQFSGAIVGISLRRAHVRRRISDRQAGVAPARVRGNAVLEIRAMASKIGDRSIFAPGNWSDNNCFLAMHRSEWWTELRLKHEHLLAWKLPGSAIVAFAGFDQLTIWADAGEVIGPAFAAWSSKTPAERQRRPDVGNDDCFSRPSTHGPNRKNMGRRQSRQVIFDEHASTGKGESHNAASPHGSVFPGLERQGTAIRWAYSADGRQWKSLKPIDAPWATGTVQVGVMAVNTSTEPHLVVFDNYSLTPKWPRQDKWWIQKRNDLINA